MGAVSDSLHLSSLDKQILTEVLENGFQSFSELRDGPLKTYDRSHSYAVLRKLVKKGYLEASEIREGVIGGWTLSSPYKAKVLSQNPKLTAVPRTPSYKGIFDHDLRLRRLRKLFLREFPVQEWVNEADIRARMSAFVSNESRRERMNLQASIPDGLIRFSHGGRGYWGAIELELTRRTRNRLTQKMEQRLLAKDYSFVFYIVKDEHLEKVLVDAFRIALTHSIEVSIAHRLNGIYFATVAEIEQSGASTTFRSLRNSFQFEKKST